MREIVIWPDPVLSAPTGEVTAFDPELHALLDEMHQAMDAAKGIGLAANQIGVPLRVALAARGDGTVLEMVNPRITARRGEVLLGEGCLSLPGEREAVHRAEEVEVRWQDRDGQPHQETAGGQFAHVVQHEVDHLEGKVYAVHLSAMKRDILRRRMLKLKKSR